MPTKKIEIQPKEKDPKMVMKTGIVVEPNIAYAPLERRIEPKKTS